MREASVLSPEEKERLLRDYAQNRDPALRDKLVKEHLRMASMVAGRFLGRGVEYDDLFQVASLALVRALERFDPDQGVKFSSYAVSCMLGEIKHYFRDRARLIRLPRTASELLRLLEKAIEETEQEVNRQPTVEELARKMGVGEERVLEILEMRGAARPVSLNSPEGEQDEPTLADCLGIQEAGYGRFETVQAVRSALEILDMRKRSVIELRYFENLSQRQTAQRLGISQMSVSRTEKRALEEMRQHLEYLEE